MSKMQFQQNQIEINKMASQLIPPSQPQMMQMPSASPQKPFYPAGPSQISSFDNNSRQFSELQKQFQSMKLDSQTYSKPSSAPFEPSKQFYPTPQPPLQQKYPHKVDGSLSGVPLSSNIQPPTCNKINFVAVLNDKEHFTTIMIRNIPMRFTQADMLRLVDKHHALFYDYFYLPIDLKVRLIS